MTKEHRDKSDLKKVVLALLLVATSTSVQTVHGDGTTSSTNNVNVPPISLGFDEFESMIPSLAPTPTVTDEPTSLPTLAPSQSPSVTRSVSPSAGPTQSASSTPSTSPSSEPTQQPSNLPSISLFPSMTPTQVPTAFPSKLPTGMPSSFPSTHPSAEPSHLPSASIYPTGIPTQVPTRIPTAIPTSFPSLFPTQVPTHIPSVVPTSFPSLIPTSAPSRTPSIQPTSLPSLSPSWKPSTSTNPSNQPSNSPSHFPSETNVMSYSAEVIVKLKSFSAAMDEREKDTFQNTLKSFVTTTMSRDDDKVDITITSVEVTKQFKRNVAQNGLGTAEDFGILSERALEETGLILELVITGDVSYGTIPENFSFADTIKPGFQDEFDQLLNELDASFTSNLAIGGQDGVDEEQPSTNTVPGLGLILTSLGCALGGIVLAATLFLVQKKKKSTRLRELQDQSQFAHAQSPSRNDGLEYPCEIQNEAHWNWVDPNETNIKKLSENPYGGIGNTYSVHSNPTQDVYSLQSSEISASDQETPTGSASASSMGINLSPEALYEARKQHQTFCFVPQDARSAGISHSYPDQNGRLVYKSYVCSAPAGPLGIIIDTTAEGPMVHAIKPTSELLGSIAPGDIVVGLDNIETRQMTAPALTRLMARKSQQTNRRITLLRPMSS